MPSSEGYKNLIPANKQTKEQHLANVTKGGKTVTQKQRRSQKLRRIRERMEGGQLHDADERWLYARATDKEAAHLDILNWLDKMRKEASDEKIEASLLNTYNQILKTIHGERIRIDSKTVNLNMELSMTPEFEQELKDHFGEE